MPTLHAPLSWSTTPHEVWRAYQLRRLRDYLSQRVLPFSAHYRRLFADNDIHPEDFKTIEDWAAVPFTSKSDLTVPREQQREFVLMPEERVLKREWKTIRRALFHGSASAKEELEREFRPVLLTSTTGRSSDPVPFLFTKHDVANLEITGRRLMEAANSQRDFRHANVFPFAPHLGFWQTHYAGMGFGTFMLSTGGGKALGTEGNIALIDKTQPDALIGMPTFVYHLLLQAVDEKRHWPNIKRIVLGGEKVAEGLRARLKELAATLGSTDAVILSTYGFTEAKMAFSECASEAGTSGFHLSPDLGIVELVDPHTGQPVEEGQPGEIVFTPLDSRGTVVLRYRTGDIAEGGLTWARCPLCGRTCPRLQGPISRVSEVRELQFDKIKGVLVNFNILEHLLDDQKGIAAWQIELGKLNGDPLEVDELTLHVAPDAGIEASDLEYRIARRFTEVTEIKPNRILFHDINEMRDRLGIGRLLKEQKLVDLRKAGAAENKQKSGK